MVNTFRYTGRLVALDYGVNGYFAWRDEAQTPIPVRAVGLPVIIQWIPMRTPFSQVMSYFENEPRGPPEANAFTHKIVPGEVGDRTYQLTAQYYEISQRDWEAIRSKSVMDHRFGGFFDDEEVEFDDEEDRLSL